MIMTKEHLENALAMSAQQKDKSVREMLIKSLAEEIKKAKLPYQIRNGMLFDMSETTAAYLDRFITQHLPLIEMKKDICKLAKVDSPVLITGETGTGKELVARALHGEKAGDFYGINCAGLPEELVESELFGHKQGSFTGAVKDKDGLMKLASSGTLFLDEVGELPLMAQAKLLRAIQERRIRKVGGDKSEEISCRIVCATNRDIKDMCDKGLFRIDLYARISTFELFIPPLSERPADVALIIRSLDGGNDFLKAFAEIPDDPKLDISLNVRSLQKHVERFKILGRLPIV